jgi:WGR domain
MPKPPKRHVVRRVPIQLPLFADAASLIRVRPERNEWRFYRMEVWPDLFGRALLLRQWGRIGTEVGAASIHIQIRALPSTHSPTSQGGSAGAAIRTGTRDPATPP